MNPPSKVTVIMEDRDVEKNLVDIVRAMEHARMECLGNMEMDDGIKMHYLRFTAELASCLEPKLAGNIEFRTRKLMQFVGKDPMLLRYDDIQEGFWGKRQPKFRDSLDRAAILLLGDNFTSTSQSYHILQGLKYLHASEDKEAVYGTILPFNSLLSESSLSDPVVAEFVMSHLFKGYMEQVGNGLRIDDKSLANAEFIERLKELGALYVDLPQNAYSKMKDKFHTIVVEEGGKKSARVLLRAVDSDKAEINIFGFLAGYAVMELSEKGEASIKPGIKSQFSFGKGFVEEMEGKMGVNIEKSQKQGKPGAILTLDDLAADNGANKTQGQWIEYWNRIKDGRRFPSMAELYQVFRQIAGEPEKHEALLKSVRKDFEERWLLSSTRIICSPNDESATIMHNYGSGLQKEPIDLEIPVYRNIQIETVLSQDKGLNYLQKLLGTEDRAEEIISVFEKLSNKPKSEIRVWTPDIGGNYPRAKYPERAASLYYFDGCFHVLDYFILNNVGRSRAVAASGASLEARSAPGAKK